MDAVSGSRGRDAQPIYILRVLSGNSPQPTTYNTRSISTPVHQQKEHGLSTLRSLRNCENTSLSVPVSTSWRGTVITQIEKKKGALLVQHFSRHEWRIPNRSLKMNLPSESFEVSLESPPLVRSLGEPIVLVQIMDRTDVCSFS